MRAQHLPAINLRYWCGIALASVFGTNMGDYYAHTTGLGIGTGLGLLAILCAIVFAAERLDHAPRELYYWLVIIIIRTGATNIADFSAYRLGIPELLLNGGLIALLAILGAIQMRQNSDARSAGLDRGLASTGGVYWLAMLTAGVLGTVLGDVCEHAFGEGVSAIALTLILAVLLLWRRNNVGGLYWLIIAVARTAGTAVGDWLAENHLLNIGLPVSTAITAAFFAGILILWRWPSPAKAAG